MKVSTGSEPVLWHNSGCSKLKNCGAAMLIASINAITASHNNSDERWIDNAVSVTKFFEIKSFTSKYQLTSPLTDRFSLSRLCQ